MNEVYVFSGTLYVPYIDVYVYWDVICSLHERITLDSVVLKEDRERLGGTDKACSQIPSRSLAALLFSRSRLTSLPFLFMLPKRESVFIRGQSLKIAKLPPIISYGISSLHAKNSCSKQVS